VQARLERRAFLLSWLKVFCAARVAKPPRAIKKLRETAPQCGKKLVKKSPGAWRVRIVQA